MCWAVNVRIAGIKLITEALDIVLYGRVVDRTVGDIGSHHAR